MLTRSAVARVSTLRLGLAILQKGVAFLSVPLVAAIFGTRGEYESYLVASSVPTLVVAFISLGAINIIFIPVFNDYRSNHGEQEAWKFASAVVSVYMVLVLLISVVGVAASPLLLRLAAPGLPPDLQELGSRLAMALFLSAIVTGVGSALAGVLNSYNILVAPSACQLAGAATGVAVVFILQDTIGPWSLVLSSILTSLIPVTLMVIIYRKLFRGNLKLTWNIGHPGMKQAMALFVANSVSIVAIRLGDLSTRFFASLIGPGAIATFDYANRLTFMIMTLFINTVTVPLFAQLSHQAANRNQLAIRDTFSFGVRMLGLILIPVTSLALFLREPIIQLLYERGAFTHETTVVVASLFSILAITIVLQGFSNLLGYVYYALQKPKPVVVIVVGSIAATILLSAVLVGPLELKGLAVATSLAYIIGTVCNYLYLRRLVGGLDEAQTAPCLFKVTLAALIAGATGWFIMDRWPLPTGSGLIMSIVALLTSFAAGIFAYLLLLLALRVEEAYVVLRRVLKSWRLVVVRIGDRL